LKDYRPDSRDRLSAQYRASRDRSNWLAAIAAAFLASCAGLYLAGPVLFSQAPGLLSLSTPRASEQEFASLYTRYGMPPLEARFTGVPKIHDLLEGLQREPCAENIAIPASRELQRSKDIRGAANLLRGFGTVCPDAAGALYEAAELFLGLGDYDTALRLTGQVIALHPDADRAYWVQGLAEQALGRHEAALEDYAMVLRSLPDPANIKAELFTRMSESYAKLFRFCEAITPLQTYIGLAPATRSTPALERRMALLARQGNCTQSYARGAASIVRQSGGVFLADIEVNGVAGRFIIDTGASLVTLTPAFATKAKPQMFTAGSLALQAANGFATGRLATLDSVRIGALSASAVPAVVLAKSLGTGVDGLLGMSLLSRFTVVIDAKGIQLSAKSLQVAEDTTPAPDVALHPKATPSSISQPEKKDLLAKLQTSSVDVLSLVTDPNTMATLMKMQQAMKEDPTLLQDLRGMMVPGEPLPYDKRFKVSEKDYLDMLQASKKIRLIKQRESRIEVSRDASGKITISAKNLGVILEKGVTIDPDSDTVEFNGVSKLIDGEAFNNTDGALAPLSGFQWKRINGLVAEDPAQLSAEIMKFTLAKTGDPEKCFLAIEAKSVSHGRPVIRDDLYLHFNCR
jgi:aspartyl protease family protein